MKKLLFLGSLMFIIASSSCIIDFDGNGPFGCIDGNGNIITEEFNLPRFDEIRLTIPAYVTIEQGDEQQVTVEGDENIVNMLKLDVNNRRWKIDTRRCIDNVGTLNIHIVTEHMEGITVSGSGEVLSTNTLVTDRMDIVVSGSGSVDIGLQTTDVEGTISGSGKIYMEGSADYADYKVSGSGDIRAFDLICQIADITISGSGTAEVTVEERLKVKISGSGDVYYRGDPELDTTISGSGDVVDAN